MPTKHNFDQIVKSYKQFKKTLPQAIGTEAVNFAKDNFRRQGFQDIGVRKWKKRKPGSQRNKGRGILIDTGKLKRSIRITRITGSRVYIGSNVIYAQIHNEGGRIKGSANVRAHRRRTRSGGLTRVKRHTRQVNIRMPKRQFIGRSRMLDRRIQKYIRLRLLKVFKA